MRTIGMTLCALFSAAFLSSAAAAPGVAAPQALGVIVQLCVEKQTPERIEETLTTPLERVLLGVPGVSSISSNTSDDGVVFNIHFKLEATESDLANVEQALDRHASHALSRSIRLDIPREEEFFSVRSSCEAPPRRD